MLLLNTQANDSFEHGLRQLVGAHSLQIACSYLKPRGWLILRSLFGPDVLKRSRLIFTDQLGITDPHAIRLALDDGVTIHRFSGEVTFHPKCFLGFSEDGEPKKYVIGSANISVSALRTGVEAGVLGQEPERLRRLAQWVAHLFDNSSVALTPEILALMEEAWKSAAAARAKARLKIVVVAGKPVLAEGAGGLADTYEDAFDSISEPIGMLNFDYAGNNIRTLDRARWVLDHWPEVGSKASSELKLIGMASGGALTDLGVAAAKTKSHVALAEVWCKWLVATPDIELWNVNPRLLSAKRALSRFARMNPEVIGFFLANATDKSEKKLLQTIELLCSASDMVEQLTLKEIRVLSNLLPTNENMDSSVASTIHGYFANKGARGWEFEDRRMLVTAFRNALTA